LFTFVEIKLKQIMAHDKTETNKKKAGRPRLEPTSVISVRIPTKTKQQVEERFGKHWQGLFKDFCRVYLLDDENK
jgi:hypothetical protein